MSEAESCPHTSWTGAEGPAAKLGRMPMVWTCDGCGAIRCDFPINEVLAHVRTAALAEGERKGIERACKAQCLYCREDRPILVGLDGAWHRDALGNICHCEASAIRALLGADTEPTDDYKRGVAEGERRGIVRAMAAEARPAVNVAEGRFRQGYVRGVEAKETAIHALLEEGK